MWIWKRVKQLEASVRYLEDRASKIEAAAAALSKRLDEMEPELEQYKVGVEEAAAYERSMNDGMASIFGYTAPSMRGTENGER